VPCLHRSTPFLEAFASRIPRVSSRSSAWRRGGKVDRVKFKGEVIRLAPPEFEACDLVSSPHRSGLQLSATIRWPHIAPVGRDMRKGWEPVRHTTKGSQP